MPQKASAEEFESPTRDLQDLVKMCNMASRHGAGDILWLSYQVSDSKKSTCHARKPSFGNLAWAYTKRGAEAVLARIPRSDLGVKTRWWSQRASSSGEFEPSASSSGGPSAGAEPSAASTRDEDDPAIGPIGRKLYPGHWDISMKNLIKGTEGKVMRAGYVFPPVGNFCEHPDSFAEYYEKEGRPSCWHLPWCAQGTRPEEDREGRERQVFRAPVSGEPDELGNIQAVDGDSQWWRSYWTGPEDLRPLSKAEYQDKLKRERAANKRRPAEEVAAGTSSKCPAPPPPLKRSRAAGAGASASSAASSSTRLSLPPPPPPPPRPLHQPEEAERSRRQNRMVRDLTLSRGRRVWVSTEEEARISKTMFCVGKFGDTHICRC